MGVKNIIRQNKKDALLEFLFGATKNGGSNFIGSIPTTDQLEKKIQNQLNSLQERVIQVKSGNLNVLSEANRKPKTALSETQMGHTTLSQKQAQNRANFKTLGKIPEEEKIEIIKLGLKVYF